MVTMMATVLQYMEAAMRRASYERIEGGAWFASIPGLGGLWATGSTIEEARKDLLEALDGWIEVSAKAGCRLPDIDGVSLYDNLKKIAED